MTDTSAVQNEDGGSIARTFLLVTVAGAPSGPGR